MNLAKILTDIALLVILVACCGLAISVKSVFWNAETVQTCWPHATDANLLECRDMTYRELRTLMFEQWLTNVENSPADFWPDGKIDMKDFAELSKNWRN